MFDLIVLQIGNTKAQDRLVTVHARIVWRKQNFARGKRSPMRCIRKGHIRQPTLSTASRVAIDLVTRVYLYVRVCSSPRFWATQ